MSEELPDEPFGNLMLKRKEGGTGYMYVTGPKSGSKKKPYQARIKNSRTGTTQHLGMYRTAHEAAQAVAAALAGGDNDDMDSPRKHAKRGMLSHHTRFASCRTLSSRHCLMCSQAQ